MKKTKDKKPKEKVTQLDFGIKEPFKNKYFKAKGKTEKIVRKIEVKKSLRDPLTWGVVIIGLVLIATQGYLIHLKIDNLPSLLPVFQYQIQHTSKLVDKWYVLIYPIISGVVLLLSIITTSKFYSREVYLSKLLLVVAFLSSLSSTIILVDLINRF